MVSNQPEFVEGRLHFKSTKQLANRVNELKKLNETQLKSEMSKFYSKGFKPLRPFYGTNDFELIQEYSTQKLKSFKSSDYEDVDDEDPLIGDEFFAAFLNENREIQVGDTIYKYTETGLYFSHIDDVDELYQYLEELDFKRNLKLVQPIDPCGLEPQEFGTQAMNAYVMRYIPVPDCGGSTGGGGNSGGGSTGGISGDTFISNLQKCDERYRDLKIFGDIVSCIDKFDNRHRTKTKFFKQNYKLYAAIGISAKYQKRVAGIFWTTKTDEIRLGVNQMYFEYNMPIPDYSNIVKTYIIYQGKVYDNYLNVLNTGQIVVPELPFNDQFNTITIYVALPLIGLVKKDITEEDVNKAFWNFAWGKAKSLAKKLSKSEPTKLSMVGFNREKVIVQHYNKGWNSKNDGKLMKLYDFNFLVRLNFLDILNHTFGWSSITITSIYDYKNAKIDIYGAARNGSTWKGSRVIWKDN